MAVYAIFDVEIKDMNKYQEYMNGVKPAIESVGARYLGSRWSPSSHRRRLESEATCYYRIPII